MKQITIYKLLPLMRPGWVAKGAHGWAWFGLKPTPHNDWDCATQYAAMKSSLWMMLKQRSRTMPDISMCFNEKCPLKMKCYRFTAIPNTPYQTCTLFVPVNGKCDGFWDNTGRRSRFDTKDKQ